MAEAGGIERELLLVGGGHAHVQVLRRFAMAPEPGVHLTLVVDTAEAVYSGMVPGVVAGDHPLSDAVIDCLPLARRARARVIVAEALRVDLAARRLEVAGRPPLAFDVLSLNLGGSVAGLSLPGVREHALATRPIGAFVSRMEERLAQLEPGSRVRVVVVGAGGAGCELSLCVEARLREEGLEPEVELLSGTADLSPGPSAGLGRLARRELAARGVRLRFGQRVASVGKDGVVLEDGQAVEGDLVLWATGAAPPALLGASELPRDERGFVRVDEQLRVVGRSDVFAVGDCAAFDAQPLSKAGVFAVRQGPVLADNLRRALVGRPLRAYRPQRDFVVLLNAGGGRALGGRGPFHLSGRLAWHWKRWLDRRFMRRFQVLEPSGAPAPTFPSPESMGMEEMPCGGCAAKLGPVSLAAALARLPAAPKDPRVLLGLDAADDAAAVRGPSGDVWLATVDGFRAFTDDPYLVGQVAAINAVSDVHAKGGVPAHALAWVGVPDAEGGDDARAGEPLYQTLCGIRAALDPLGVSLLGGHTTTSDELVVGITVFGEMPEGSPLLTNAGARPGDALILTKPLGSGVLLAADMRGLAPARQVLALHRRLVLPNDEAGRIARESAAHAVTDVSGFGLARHAAEMAEASGVALEVDLAALPAYDGALDALARGVRSSFHASNRSEAPVAMPGPASGPSQGSAAGARADAADVRVELCFDPQTAGGLLIALPEARAGALLDALRQAGQPAARIGRVLPSGADGPPVTLLGS
ncbi:MAG: selenide, water dikinase SelD [Myxococcota bacterium]|nr:selenide, water dikinase SelD [Myxococcota bacterium]